MTDETPQHRAEGSYDTDGSVVGQLNPMFSNKTYDRLKFVAQILLPAVGAFYFALAGFWGLPNADSVVGTIVAADALLGAILGFSSASYRGETEGKLVGFADVHVDDEGTKQVSLEFPGDPMTIDKHDKITFKVRKH